jgi:thiol-disulfide isomerase/thioredoxin
VTSGWRSALRALASAAILFAATAAGFLAYRHMGPERPSLHRVPLAPAPEAAAEGASPPPHAIPEQLPDFSLPDLEGHPHRLADWRGGPLVVNFWATWCEPCRREVPLLRQLRRENSANKLEIVGIAIDHADSVRNYAKELGMEYPILVGEQGGLEAVAAFGMDTVLPFTVFADPQGRIVTLKIGELHRDEAAFILARLADVGAGRLGLAAAREQIARGMRRLAVSRATSGRD